MSLEQGHENGHNMGGHDAPGVEAGTGGLAAPNVVIRHPDGGEISSLDTNHDGVVGMRELNPPRPENGHDLANVAIAGTVLVLAGLATAAAMGARRLWPNRGNRGHES